MSSYVYHYSWPNGSKQAQQGYVGKANNPTTRLKDHLKGKGSPLIIRAIKKYGNPKIEMWACNNENEAYALEIKKIKELNTLYPAGYNLTNGGEGFDSESAKQSAIILNASRTTEQKREIARKASAARTSEQKQKFANLVYERSIEQRQEISRKATAHLTFEQRQEKSRKMHNALSPEQRRERSKRAVASRRLKANLPNWSQMPKKLQQATITEYLKEENNCE